MEIYIGFLVSFGLLIFSVLKNIYTGYVLIVCWIIFALISLKRGHSLKEILGMSYGGGKQSFVVIRILILIGAVTGIWMASGTIPTIVYYCLKYITPSAFIFSAFVICSAVSFLTGTSFETVSTVGVPLMIMARSGDINVNIAAGAIIAGAYFGDRCSPMSSSAALVAGLTKTNMLDNIRLMFHSSIVPFFLSLIFYFILSVSQPLESIKNNLSGEILGTFKIAPLMLLPALIIIVLSLCRVKTHISISVSILTAFVLALLFQNNQLKDAVNSVIFGFRISGGPLENIINGGGIVSMLKTCLVVFVSCSIAGLFEGIKMFGRLESKLKNLRMERHNLFGVTSIISIITAAFGCSQSISTVMTKEIMKDCYRELDNNQFALDLENSGIIISALIPWNIAAFVPTATLNVSPAGYIPYAFYLYILPVVFFIYSKYSQKAQGPENKKSRSIEE
ncbi:MAG: Malate-2H(+)/Na(+)-lactate antiporter [Firmicutes bacterium ADurb.Bin182]|nr:MAG: Malate-2H(+)/Na(+)-lactate antiporter [Firmicutes bacterium ADurb.Bin182]